MYNFEGIFVEVEMLENGANYAHKTDKYYFMMIAFSKGIDFLFN